MALDPRVDAIRDEYGLSKDDFWQLPQSKNTWCVKHAALEIVAAKAGITFDPPMIVEANGGAGIAAVCVTGHFQDRSIWSIGEASPKNSKNAYPWAMAEKRAIDRVVLKLVGIHGLVYSDAEIDTSNSEPEKRQTHKEKTGQTVEETRPIWREMADEIYACQSIEDLFALWAGETFKAEFAKLPASWQVEIINAKDAHKEHLTGAA